MQTNDKCQIELLLLDKSTWNHLTVLKKMRSGSFKNVTNKLFAFKSYTKAGFDIK